MQSEDAGATWADGTPQDNNLKIYYGGGAVAKVDANDIPSSTQMIVGFAKQAATTGNPVEVQINRGVIKGFSNLQGTYFASTTAGKIGIQKPSPTSTSIGWALSSNLLFFDPIKY
jgi:hypothetical protein